MFEQINRKKVKLDTLRPLPKYTLKSLREKLLLEWTYNTNAIEGNTLTMNETKVVLEGITVGGKTMREHLEVINHRDAIAYVEEIVQKGEPLTEWQIKNLHRLVLKGIDDEYAGVYRDQQVFIAGAKHTPPAPYLIKEQMEQLIKWYENEAQKLHPVERGAMLHAIFVGIHPFIDGNGRTSRLLLNLELMKAGFPAIVIKVENRLAYYEALDKSHTTKNYQDFIQLIVKEVEDSLNLYLSALS
ncbi:Fic family protein (plasmid) [Priestia megaterium]|jgi:Fic family protein|uniref:Fic family protein n=1 Tax=Priestia TaxID=2800373 RepID=UPI000BF522F4|nr:MULTISPECIES: Fic family protein [Priestia]MDP9580602.1 Fic family protein [Bacillus sp. 1751]MDH2449322.1 Fic family protein [Priestia megaterium]MDL5148780.1 Fic family protein [Priestia megaterium]MDP9726460.1 Fic family protein [Priestia aryabhattai]PER70918.1 cell filamentation protein Fic [Priestia megaterium]